MNLKEQAIKIEQLKQARDESHNAILSEKLFVSGVIDNITNQMLTLGSKRKYLYDKLGELREKDKRNADHYNLLIKAVTSLAGEQTK